MAVSDQHIPYLSYWYKHLSVSATDSWSEEHWSCHYGGFIWTLWLKATTPNTLADQAQPPLRQRALMTSVPSAGQFLLPSHRKYSGTKSLKRWRSPEQNPIDHLLDVLKKVWSMVVGLVVLVETLQHGRSNWDLGNLEGWSNPWALHQCSRVIL